LRDTEDKVKTEDFLRGDMFKSEVSDDLLDALDVDCA
jgi:hypothetical protein